MKSISFLKLNIFCLCLTLNFFISSNEINKLEDYHEDFNISMKANSRFFKKKYSNLYRKNCLNKLENLYALNNLSKIEQSKELKIEKNIHQIWLGGKELPNVYKKLADTWKLLHPDWNYYLWTENEVKTLDLINYKLYEQTKDLREKANILRYEILYKFGGVYVDLDIECLKNFETLHYCYDFYCGIEHNFYPPILNNALIGCSKNNPIIYHCTKTISDDWHKPTRVERSGVFHFSKSFLEMIKNPMKIIAFPMSYFYPLEPLFFSKNKSDLKKEIQTIRNSRSFAIHYYAGRASLEQISEAFENQI